MTKPCVSKKEPVWKVFIISSILITVLAFTLIYMQKFGLIKESTDYLYSSTCILIILMSTLYSSNYDIYKYIMNKIKITRRQLFTIHIPICIALIERAFTNILQILPYLQGKGIIKPAKGQLVFNSPTILDKILSTSVVAPFLEEFIFRLLFFSVIAYLLNKITKNKNISQKILDLDDISCWILIVINSILFSLMHLPDASNFHLYYIGGIVNCIIYLKYGFFSSVIAHSVYNLVHLNFIFKLFIL